MSSTPLGAGHLLMCLWHVHVAPQPSAHHMTTAQHQALLPWCCMVTRAPDIMAGLCSVTGVPISHGRVCKNSCPHTDGVRLSMRTYVHNQYVCSVCVAVGLLVHTNTALATCGGR